MQHPLTGNTIYVKLDVWKESTGCSFNIQWQSGAYSGKSWYHSMSLQNNGGTIYMPDALDSNDNINPEEAIINNLLVLDAYNEAYTTTTGQDISNNICKWGSYESEQPIWDLRAENIAADEKKAAEAAARLEESAALRESMAEYYRQHPEAIYNPMPSHTDTSPDDIIGEFNWAKFLNGFQSTFNNNNMNAHDNKEGGWIRWIQEGDIARGRLVE